MRLIDYKSSITIRGQLARAVSGSFLLQVSATGLAFLTSLVLAHVLGASGYGAYTYALAWINFLTVPALLGFDKLLVREVSVYRAQQQWEYLRGILRAVNWLALLLSLGVAGGVTALTWLFRENLDPHLLSPLWVALPLLPVFVLTRIRQATMMGFHRVVQGQMPESLARPLLFVALVLLAYLGFGESLDATWAVGIQVVAAVTAFLIGAFMLSQMLRVECPQRVPNYRLRRWLSSAIPLALLASLQIINARVDILMLGAMKDAESVGIYNVCLRGASLISFILAAVNAGVAPMIARYYAQNDLVRLQRLVTVSSRIILGLSLPIGAVMILFGDVFLGLFGMEFPQGYNTLVILSIGQIVSSGMGSVGLILTMTNHERLAVKGAAIAALGNVGLNWLLIPYWGMEGAAVASTVTLIVWNVLYGCWIYKRIGVVPSALGRT